MIRPAGTQSFVQQPRRLIVARLLKPVRAPRQQLGVVWVALRRQLVLQRRHHRLAAGVEIGRPLGEQPRVEAVVFGQALDDRAGLVRVAALVVVAGQLAGVGGAERQGLGLFVGRKFAPGGLGV